MPKNITAGEAMPKVSNLDTVRFDIIHLSRLLDTAVLALGEMEFGAPENRNNELDRLDALIQIGRDMAERLEADIDALPWHKCHSGEQAFPAIDFSGWTIFDFEIAVDTLIRVEHAVNSVVNQPRGVVRGSLIPGAAWFTRFQERWADRQLNVIIEHLKSVRFGNLEHDSRRILLILKFQAEYPDPDELASLLKLATGQLTESESTHG